MLSSFRNRTVHKCTEPKQRMKEEILYVEDEMTEAAAKIAAFARIGHHVRHTASGERALLLAKEYPETTIMITDYNLHGIIDGIQVVKEVRRLIPDALFIFCSGQMSDELRKAALEAGAHIACLKAELTDIVKSPERLATLRCEAMVA
jgi:CheY-like chemotaxis protein